MSLSEQFEINPDKYDVLARYSAPVKRAERKILGREKQIQSIMAAFSRPELCNVILLAPAGSGKALDDNELIAVNDARGYVRMGDIKVGDEVFDEKGNPTKVVGVYPQGLKRAYRVTFANGSNIVCNDEHLWGVRNRQAHRKNKPYEVMTLGEMMAQGIKQMQVKRSGAIRYERQWFVPRACAVDRAPVPLPIEPYALGALIGGSCFASQYGDALTMLSDDTSVVDRVARYLGAVAQCDFANNTWAFCSLETHRLLCASIVFADEMFDKTVRLRKPAERRIPSVYLTGSRQQRFELLRGLMDADGRVSGTKRLDVSYVTSSAALCRDVRTLAASLGFATSVTHIDGSDGTPANREYAVHFSALDDAKLDLFTLPRHRERIIEYASSHKSKKRYDDMAIVDVHDMGVEIPMTCIYVEAESHLFQAGLDHIVTHNTALVQATMLKDTDRAYLDVDVSKMIAEHGADTLGAELKILFDQTKQCVDETGHEIVLFIDEFHKIINVSESAVEDLKPLLADSGTRGIRVLAATTLEEFNKYISGNQPLVERLQRINVPEPDEDLTVAILKGMAERYGVGNEFYNDHIYHRIYEYTNRYIPANSQPRKSILVLDAMVGWHRFAHRRLDDRLLADVIMESEDVNVAFRIDATKVKQALDSKVLDQGYASMQISKRLQLCVADLNDKTKPMSTFLFTGSTGVGKTEMTKQLANILFGDERRLIRFDMTEYANSDTLERFRDLLTTRVWEHPYSIILLDEIEKACPEVTRLLLQVLDDGRLTNRNNREISFTNAYIVLTTNAGSEIYQTVAQYATGDGDDELKALSSEMQEMERQAGTSASDDEEWVERYDKLIRRSISQTQGANRFPPELLGRIDMIVPFKPLSRSTMRKIVRMRLQRLQKEVLSKHNIQVAFDFENVITYLVDDKLDTDSNSGGARIVMSVLERDVTTAIARHINEQPPASGRLYVTVDDPSLMAIASKTRLKSEAHIVVGEPRA